MSASRHGFRVLLPEGEGSEEEARMFRGLMMLMMMMVVVVVMGISGDIDVAKWGSCKLLLKYSLFRDRGGTPHPECPLF